MTKLLIAISANELQSCSPDIKVTFVILHAHTKLQQPAFSVRIEECVRQIVPIILWDFEGLVFDAVVKVLQAGEKKKSKR